MKHYDDWITRFEESVLAIILATMTVVSFTQVVARYGFNAGWTGALEFTRIFVCLDDIVWNELWD